MLEIGIFSPIFANKTAATKQKPNDGMNIKRSAIFVPTGKTMFDTMDNVIRKNAMPKLIKRRFFTPLSIKTIKAA